MASVPRPVAIHGKGCQNCPFCNFRVSNVSLLLSHLRHAHSNDMGFFLSCGAGGCSNMYTNSSSFRTHVYRHHKDYLPVPSIARVSNSTLDFSECMTQEAVSDVEQDSYQGPVESVSHEVDQFLGEDLISQQRISALFLLRMKEIFGVSQTALNGLVAESTNVFELSMKRLEAGVFHTLSKAGIDTERLTGLHDIFKNMQFPFSGLTSKYLQEKYYTQFFNLVVCDYTDYRSFLRTLSLFQNM